MSSEDISYYRQRAEAERDRAKTSSNGEIAEIHEELARLYDALLEHKELRPARPILRIVTPKVA